MHFFVNNHCICHTGESLYPWKTELCSLLDQSQEKKVYFVQGENVGKSKFTVEDLGGKYVNHLYNCMKRDDAKYGIFHVGINPLLNTFVHDIPFAFGLASEEWPYGIYQSLIEKRWYVY